MVNNSEQTRDDNREILRKKKKKIMKSGLHFMHYIKRIQVGYTLLHYIYHIKTNIKVKS
jgi:hypothetical protein